MLRARTLFNLLCFSVYILTICAFNVPDLCFEECGSKIITDEEDLFDVACNISCKIEKCRDGCNSWMEGIAASCKYACLEENETLDKNSNLYCVMGCNIAISTYISRLKDEIGPLSPPYLVADSCTNVSVTIQWTSAPFSNISYLVQLRYESPHQSMDWEYYEPFNILTSNELIVRNLHPYTNYKFRVAYILLKNVTPLFSEESVAISTLAYGLPSSKPILTCLTAVGETRISVSWEPPTFPNGPVLSYVLYAQEYPSGPVIIKDVSDTSGVYHYMFNDLKPATTYVISATTRNSVGEGPADVKNITTPKQDTQLAVHHSQPYVVFAAQEHVMKQGMHILDESSILNKNSSSSHRIQGVALHVKKDLLLFSDSGGFIHHMKLKGEPKVETIFKDISDTPTVLSVDWLNEHLYLAQSDQISRCNLKGDHFEIVLTGLIAEPSTIHVDPFNGYLFWAVRDPTIGGVYRIDLAELNSGPKTLKDAEEILRDDTVMAFAVDYRNFRLLIPDSQNNTIISSALDGTDRMDIRRNSKLIEVLSIAVYNGLFYWTNGVDMFAEEYHKQENEFYQNAYSLKNGPFSNINVHHEHCQPEPTPFNPVESVEAVFSDTKAKIRWSLPRLIGGAGKGSWQKWSYELHLTGHDTSLQISEKNITKPHHMMVHLEPNTSYTIRVRAYSPGGKGPWSSAFHGRTLNSNNFPYHPFILYSTREGLLKSDVIGDEVQRIIPKIYLNNAHIKGISWYDGSVFLNTNSSMVYVYNVNGNHSLSRLNNITNAASIAVDWLAPKIYWSSPVQQMISRADLDGSRPEPLPISTMAKQLAIDAPRGFIYWATSHSIECSRVNGEGHFTYMKNQLFSGKHVLGLTLDFDRDKIYWVVRNHEGSMMYRASLTTEISDSESGIHFELVGSLPEDDIHGPTWYFNDRLFWIHERKGALLSDMLGHNVASLQEPSLIGLKTLAVVDPLLQPYPGEFNQRKIRVVPTSIPESSIQVEGNWDNFSISWDSSRSTNYGSLFYKLQVDDGDEKFNLVTEEARFSYPTMRKLPPYSPLSVAVIAYTYWASSKKTVVQVYSPMSTPSKPMNPRVYIVYQSTPSQETLDIQAIFRWQAPLAPNGIIDEYQIFYFNINNKGDVFEGKVDAAKLEFLASNLEPNATYNFQVRAYTKVGASSYSDAIQAKTSEQHPVPMLVITKSDTVQIADVDTHEQKSLSRKASRPGSLAYLAQENRIFWIEEDGALMSSSLDGKDTTMIRHLTSKVKAISVDWISRVLYWATVEKDNVYSSIWSLNLNKDPAVTQILNHSGVITSLEAEPFTSSLLWTVKRQRYFELMISDNNGSNVKLFFRTPERPSDTTGFKSKRQEQENRPCNCSPEHPVGKAIAVDNSDSQAKVFWVDGKHGHIFSSDMSGCKCELFLNASLRHNGLPPTSMAIDMSRIYWTNESLGKLYSVNRGEMMSKNSLYAEQYPLVLARKDEPVITENMIGIRNIRAIGNNVQPLPEQSCLFPQPNSKVPKLLHKSSTSLKVDIPPAVRPPQCNKISLAAVRYTVRYSLVSGTENLCSDELKSSTGGCMVLETYSNILDIQNLRTFSNYSISVAVSNYYSTTKLMFGPSVVYRTSEGAPSAPTNVTAKVITPRRIDVFWQPPLYPNGDFIYYEVRWRSDNSFFSKEVHVQNSDRNIFSYTIETDKPGTNHSILVRSYSFNGKMHSNSAEVDVVTYDLPNNLTLLEVTAHAALLAWESPIDERISYHTLEYSKQAKPVIWYIAVSNEPTQPSTIYEFPILDLDSKTKYNFRLNLTYSTMREAFKWPRDNFLQLETNGDIPSKPGEPQIRHVNRAVYQIFWQEALFNDGEDLAYELQMRSANDEAYHDWSTVYNSSNTEWLVGNISSNLQYEFRVRAVNEYGGSNYTFSNETFFLPEHGAFIGRDEDEVGIIMASGMASFILVAVLMSIIYMVHRRREKDKKVLHDNMIHNQLSPELELATLQELPRHSNFVHQTNALYNMGEDLPTDEDLLAHPHVRRDQIVLTKFLGSGAFGEVFEGIAHDLQGMPPMKVAIKTLRKGATHHEKEEFLKEAKLMSNFKHDHILKLLAVSFDSNPHFIILELMEGGDLLSYLRGNRTTSALTLDDLLAICVDVAQGCKYLEDMHFVHRDLAARNCLVSSHNREERIVKIGDFGLARDIYKNDYYRKEGEGLLPVRWMAPESLVYGIFTSQSDVWAFGILLWEVMTLGKQPYPARANLEVLHYVRAGGRLDKPENCPDELHDIMFQCWSYDCDRRPTFSYCLNALQELKQKSVFLQNFPSAVQNENYIHNSDGYIVAHGGFDDDNVDDRKNLSDQDDDTISTQSDPIRSTMTEFSNRVKRSSSLSHHTDVSIPEGNLLRYSGNRNEAIADNCTKYLELLRDNEDDQGYEIPVRVQNTGGNRVTCSSSSGPQTKNIEENIMKPFLVPSYSQVFSSGNISDPVSDIFTHSRDYDDNNGGGYRFSGELSSPNSFGSYSYKQLSVRNEAFKDGSPIDEFLAEKNIDSDDHSCDRCSETDFCSISTASTVPCDSPTPSSSSSLKDSLISPIKDFSLDYVANSSYC